MCDVLTNENSRRTGSFDSDVAQGRSQDFSKGEAEGMEAKAL